MRGAAAYEDGFNLPELLVAISMMLVLLAATLPMLVATTHQGDRQSNRVTSLDNDRTAFDAMTRELRQANCVVPVVPGRSVATVAPSTAPAATAGSCSTGNAVQ